MKITLLSSSPRRREIARGLLNPVSIQPSRGEEPRPNPGETPAGYVIRSAVAKLGDGPHDPADGCLVGADTVVALDGEIFGKPATDSEARQMLRRLRNRRHQVVTGVAALDAKTGRLLSEYDVSLIYTRDYSDADVEKYIARREPFDKAGAYAVQDDDFNPVSGVEGCYLNVVGLPLCLLASLAKRLNVPLQLRPLAEIPYYERCAGCKLNQASED